MVDDPECGSLASGAPESMWSPDCPEGMAPAEARKKQIEHINSMKSTATKFQGFLGELKPTLQATCVTIVD